MYSQQDLDDAVASGAISAQAADALRAHIEQQRATVIPDEEQFRLITGFNDIFVSVAAAILLFAVGFIGQRIGVAAGFADSSREGPSFLGPLVRRDHGLGPGALFHREAANGASFDPAASQLCRAAVARVRASD